jgi:hypothetical protein
MTNKFYIDIFINMKLTVELIPKTCAASNIRTLIPTKYWNVLRKTSYKNAGFKCEICGGKGTDQGYKHDLECHEVWEYKVKLRVQKLVKLVSLCPLCHQAKHIGRAKYIGKLDEVTKHMKKVNGITKRRLDEYLEEQFTQYAEYSRIRWKLDLSYLLEICNIDKALVEKAEGKRLLENKKPPKSYYKSKYKKKKSSTKKKTTSKKKSLSKKTKPKRPKKK